MCKVGGWDKTYLKAFTTLWFLRSEILGKFQQPCKKQSNVNAPWVCIFMSTHSPCVGTLRAVSAIGMGVLCAMITYRRGAIALLVSTDRATSYEPQEVKRATVQGFTLFLCLIHVN